MNALGFSLLEFLAASSIFLALILGGFGFLDREVHLHNRMLRITRPEAELNYRMLLVRSFFDGTTSVFGADPFLGNAPAVFPDLQFGRSPQPHAFSVSHGNGAPQRFVREGPRLRCDATVLVPAGSIILVAGPDPTGAYTWDYERVTNSVIVGSDQYLEASTLAARAPPELGTLMTVDMYGLVYDQGHLYWVQPSGEWSPFVDLDDFTVVLENPTIRIRWRSGAIQSEFKVQP